MLDRGSALVNIVRGKANTPTVTLGPVVSTTADSGMGSLRYAVGTANSGDTIMFFLPAGSTVVLAGPITVSNRVTIAGPGVTVSAGHRDDRHSSATYSGVTISGNNAQQLFIVNAGGTLNLSGLILAAGLATVAHKPGGAIYNQGTVSLVSDVFTGNASVVKNLVGIQHHKTHVRNPHVARHAKTGPQPQPKQPEQGPLGMRPHICPATDFYGGAIYNNATLNMAGVIFDGNMAATSKSCGKYGYGGAIYNDRYGVLTSTGDEYVNNSAYYGGVVYNYSEYGPATFTNDVFSSNTGCTAASGCPTTGCTPGGSCTTYAYGEGGAIYDDYGPGVVVVNCTFTNNVVGGNTPESYGDGGALYLDSSANTITGSTFTNNLAGGGTTNGSEGYGGAIYSYEPLTLNNDTFTGNAAGGDYYGEGGAVYEDSYAITGSNDSFTSNVAFGSGSPTDTDGYADGGALYAYYGATLSNTTLSNNVATASYESYSGAIYTDSSSYPMTLSNDTFTSNSAIGTGVTGASTYAYGGAIYIYDYSTLSNDTFTSNTATVLGPAADECEGGAVYNDYPMQTSKVTFTSNSCVGSGYYDAYAYGGAMYNDDTWTSSGDTFNSNLASAPYYVYGGAVLNYSDMTMTGATFTSNTASGGYYVYGGGLYNDGTTASVSNSLFSGNFANGGTYGYGGGIYDGDHLTLNGSTLANNVATTAGGEFSTPTPRITSPTRRSPGTRSRRLRTSTGAAASTTTDRRRS